MSKIANNELNTRFGVRSYHIAICSDVNYKFILYNWAAAQEEVGYVKDDREMVRVEFELKQNNVNCI